MPPRRSRVTRVLRASLMAASSSSAFCRPCSRSVRTSWATCPSCCPSRARSVRGHGRRLQDGTQALHAQLASSCSWIVWRRCSSVATRALAASIVVFAVTIEVRSPPTMTRRCSTWASCNRSSAGTSGTRTASSPVSARLRRGRRHQILQVAYGRAIAATPSRCHPQSLFLIAATFSLRTSGAASTACLARASSRALLEISSVSAGSRLWSVSVFAWPRLCQALDAAGCGLLADG